MNIIKKFLAIIAILAIPAAATAQSFNGGLIVGGVVSQVNGDGYGGFHQAGFTGGGFINLPFGQCSAVQMELKYSMFGSHSSTGEVINNGQKEYKLRLNYIELPVMYQYSLTKLRIGQRSLSFITLEIGLSLNYLFNYKEFVDKSPTVYNSSDPWTKLKFSATGNVGVHFNMTHGLGLNIRYMNSILPIRVKYSEDGTGRYWDYRNNYFNIVLQAALTYTIGASKNK